MAIPNSRVAIRIKFSPVWRCGGAEVRRIHVQHRFRGENCFLFQQHRSVVAVRPPPQASLQLSALRFLPKVDEISLLTINTSNFFPDTVGGYMVAFAGRKYTARSLPAFVANSTYIVTSFPLVQEFKKGRLQKLYWKRDGCASCSQKPNFVCFKIKTVPSELTAAKTEEDM